MIVLPPLSLAKAHALRASLVAKSGNGGIDRSGACAAAGLDDSLAAIAGRTAVIAMMTQGVMPIARRGRPGGIADDDGWLA